MRRRSRTQYVVDKLVYHLGKFPPEVQLEILREVLRQLHGENLESMVVTVRPRSQHTALPDGQRLLPGRRKGGASPK